MSLAAVFNAEGLAKTVEVPKREAGDHQLEVKVHSCALNPTDWKHFAKQWGHEGDVIGSDASGVVTKVGAQVQGFKVGDFVSSFSHGGYSNDKGAGSFQEYAIFDTSTTLKHDKLVDGTTQGDSIDSFDKAAAVNLGLCTISMSFAYQFKLDPVKKYNGEWILITAGSSATGILAIQVAKKLYGLNVITTANGKYEEYLKSLGADVVIDYKSADLPAQIKAATGDDVKYALDTVSSTETFNMCNESMRPTGAAFLDNLLALQPDQLESIKSNVKLSGTLAYLVVGRDQNLNGMLLKTSDELVECHAKFWGVINKLVVDGTIKSAPVTVLPNGLDSVSDGLKKLQEGVHCTKLVFRIADTPNK